MAPAPSVGTRSLERAVQMVLGKAKVLHQGTEACRVVQLDHATVENDLGFRALDS